MSLPTKMQPQMLLLFIGFGCLVNTFAQRLPTVPTGRLLAPRLSFAESFESFDDADADSDNVQDTQEQLRQLLGQQLTSAVAPLAAAPLALLSQRQPAIVAPRSGAEAAQRFADEPDYSQEEESDEAENEADTDAITTTDTNVAQEPQQEYNAYRDSFQEHNEDGTYVFGYSLPNGVRRWERGFYSDRPKDGLFVEGFYTEPRHSSRGIQYELRCYRADSHGYHPLKMDYLQQLPRVRRNELPSNCFNPDRKKL